MKKLLLLITIISFCKLHSEAVTIELHDGSTISGELKQLTQDKVFLERNSSIHEQDRSSIMSMTGLSDDERKLVSSFYNDTTKVITGSDNLEDAAFDSLLILKNKLSAKFEDEKALLTAKFNEEKNFLEKNIEILARKLANQGGEYKKSLENVKLAEMKHVEDKSLLSRYEQDIINLKKELSYITEARLKSEVATAEKIQEALTRNKKMLEREKQSLINSYESQISEFETQLSASNMKILELAKKNSDLSHSLANSEKLCDQNGVALLAVEKQFSNYKKQISEQKEFDQQKIKDSQLALEKMLSSSADKILDLQNEIKMLKEEISFLKDENNSYKMTLDIKQKEVDSLEKDNNRYKEETLKAMKKQQELKISIKKKQKDMLKSLIDAAVIETGVEGIPTHLSKEAQRTLYNAKLKGKKDALKNRNALFGLFQNDITKLTSELNKTKKELTELHNTNASLKTNLQKTEYQVDQLTHEKQETVKMAEQFKEEKAEIKNSVDEILAEIRKEARENLEKQKNELKEHFSQAVNNLADKKQELGDFVPENYNMEDNQEVADELISVNSTADPVIDEDPDLIEEENNLLENTEKTSNQISIEVGSISQIEPEFSRVFVDTKEIISEGDSLFMQTHAGQEIPLKVLKVYSTLNGAIAEVLEPDLIREIKVKDKVYYFK